MRFRPVCVAACLAAGIAGAAPGALAGAAGAGPAGPTPSSPAPTSEANRILVRVPGEPGIRLEEALRRWIDSRGAPATDSITPAACRRFLDLLADEAALSDAARRAGLPWTPQDSLGHAQLLDRLVMRAALDSVLEDTRRAAPGAGGDPDSLGVATRERVVAGLAVRYDADVASRVAAAFRALPRPVADSTLTAQVRMLGEVPRLDSEDSTRVLARSNVGDVLAREVVEAWSRISVAYRPRIETEEHVRNLAENLLFERSLRAAAANARLGERPEIRRALEAHASSVALSQYLDREVLTRVTPDSTAARRWFDTHRGDWTLPLRVRGIRLTLSDRTAANRMLAPLRDPAQAESLLARAKRRGIDYTFEVSAASDSVLFHRAIPAGPGALLGPVEEKGAWWVARVGEVVPGRALAYEEVREAAGQRWYAFEVERRTLTLAARLRHASGISPAPGATEAFERALREITPPAASDVSGR